MKQVIIGLQVPRLVSHSIRRISDDYYVFVADKPLYIVYVFAKNDRDIARYIKYDRYVMMPYVYPYLQPDERIINTNLPALKIYHIDTGELLLERE